MSKILVVGDVMLDRYWRGDVSRLSQEAPVPVVKMSNEEHRAGAAANVAMNCASLGAQVTLIGIVGKDEGAEIVRGIVNKAGIKNILLADGSIKTTQKLRVIGRGQQIVRIDFEQRPQILLEDIAVQELESHDIVVISDYDKGAFHTVDCLIKAAKFMGKTVIVDPKGSDYTKYALADMVKPNIHELREMAGGWNSEEQLTAKANMVMADAQIGSLLVTRAGDGMTLYDKDTHHIPSKAREVYDVTGAGDTVIAAVAVMLSMGKTLLEAATIANVAAGIVVGKFGTAVCTMDELQGAMK